MAVHRDRAGAAVVDGCIDVVMPARKRAVGGQGIEGGKAEIRGVIGNARGAERIICRRSRGFARQADGSGACGCRHRRCWIGIDLGGQVRSDSARSVTLAVGHGVEIAVDGNRDGTSVVLKMAVVAGIVAKGSGLLAAVDGYGARAVSGRLSNDLFALKRP